MFFTFIIIKIFNYSSLHTDILEYASSLQKWSPIATTLTKFLSIKLNVFFLVSIHANYEQPYS